MMGVWGGDVDYVDATPQIWVCGEGAWIVGMPPLNDECVGRGHGLCGCHPSMMGVWGGDVDYVDATPQ